MSKFFTKTFLAKTTIFFTITTAFLLLTMIWGLVGIDPELQGKIIATSVTLAALSFVSFLVVSFWKE
jgi:hypothetical protein